MRIFLFCAKILHFHKYTKYSHKNDFRAAATDHDTATRIELKSHQKQRGLPRRYTPPEKATLKYRSLNCQDLTSEALATGSSGSASSPSFLLSSWSAFSLMRSNP